MTDSLFISLGIESLETNIYNSFGVFTSDMIVSDLSVIA
jgi:hypothetical protein